MNQPNILSPGDILMSPGGQFQYIIVGACCRLYNKADMSGWDGKGQQIVADIPSRFKENYMVRLAGGVEIFPYTVPNKKMSKELKQWWFKNG